MVSSDKCQMIMSRMLLLPTSNLHNFGPHRPERFMKFLL